MSKMSAYDKNLLNELITTLLYEGYSLYPYRMPAPKNQKPVQFAVIFPRDFAAQHLNSNSFMRVQCLLKAPADTKVDVSVRFLHLVNIEVYRKVNSDFIKTEELTVADNHFTQGWQAIERQIEYGATSVSGLINRRHATPITFPAFVNAENIFDEAGIAGRRIFRVMPVSGRIEVEVSGGRENIWRITARVTNQTNIRNAENVERDAAMCQSFLAAHIVLRADKGEFISAQNPPEEHKGAVSQCKNINGWPILIGQENRLLLSSPIILDDHPYISADSKGHPFDGTEMEEPLLMPANSFTDAEGKQVIHDDKIGAMMEKANSISSIANQQHPTGL